MAKRQFLINVIAFFATHYSNLCKTADEAPPRSPSADSFSVVVPVSDPSTPSSPRQSSSGLHYGQERTDQPSAHRSVSDINCNSVKTSDEAPPPSTSADSVSVEISVSDPSTPIRPLHFSSCRHDRDIGDLWRKLAYTSEWRRLLRQNILLSQSNSSSPSSTPIRPCKSSSRLHKSADRVIIDDLYNRDETSDEAPPSSSPLADSDLVVILAAAYGRSYPEEEENNGDQVHPVIKAVQEQSPSQSSTPVHPRKFSSRLHHQERAHRGFSDIYRNLVKTSDEAPPPSPSAASVSVVVDPSTSIRPRQSSSFLHYGQERLTDEQSADRLFNDILFNPLKISDGALPPPSPTDQSTLLVRPRKDSSCLHKSADRVIIDVLFNRDETSDEAPPPLAHILDVFDFSDEENNGDQVHPVIKAVQEQELGKTVISFPIAIVIGVGVAGYYILGDGWVVWLIETLRAWAPSLFSSECCGKRGILDTLQLLSYWGFFLRPPPSA